MIRKENEGTTAIGQRNLDSLLTDGFGCDHVLNMESVIQSCENALELWTKKNASEPGKRENEPRKRIHRSKCMRSMANFRARDKVLLESTGSLD